MIYLACPYSDPDPEVRAHRFECANKQAALLMAEGLHVFSPISHTHPIAILGDLPLGWGYWKKYDEKILSICDELCILALDGWQHSKGIKGELRIARSKKIKVTTVILGSRIRNEMDSLNTWIWSRTI